MLSNSRQLIVVALISAWTWVAPATLAKQVRSTPSQALHGGDHPVHIVSAAGGAIAAQRGRGRPGRRGYQEPAYARGYADGVRDGADDRRNGRGYDPVGHRSYRDGDAGYDESYGSRDTYRNNYRAGYREGYEDGYRGDAGG